MIIAGSARQEAGFLATSISAWDFDATAALFTTILIDFISQRRVATLAFVAAAATRGQSSC